MLMSLQPSIIEIDESLTEPQGFKKIPVSSTFDLYPSNPLLIEDLFRFIDFLFLFLLNTIGFLEAFVVVFFFSSLLPYNMLLNLLGEQVIPPSIITSLFLYINDKIMLNLSPTLLTSLFDFVLILDVLFSLLTLESSILREHEDSSTSSKHILLFF